MLLIGGSRKFCIGFSATGRERSDWRRDNYSFFLLRLRVTPRGTAIVPLPISPARRDGVPAFANYANSKNGILGEWDFRPGHIPGTGLFETWGF
ncbi:MAG: hypothetical protein DMG30_13435 [Acidobacteria bacterium]|nr:MAG: hypothetical protein DMG30_13435 [Acidobacteriota bacterium]